MIKQRFGFLGILVACAAFLWLGAQWGATQEAKNAAGPPEVSAQVRLADPAISGVRTIRGTTLLKGGNWPVRSVKETNFSDKTKLVSFEAFRDEDFRNLIYVTADGGLAVAPYQPNFEFRSMAGEGTFECLRFSPVSGAAWQYSDEGWKVIDESEGAVPEPGDYDIEINDPGDESIIVLRMDRRSGHTWSLKDGQWALLAEQKE